MSKTIAQVIFEIEKMHLCMSTADKCAVSTDQDFEEESTVFIFEDSSKIKISGNDKELVE